MNEGRSPGFQCKGQGGELPAQIKKLPEKKKNQESRVQEPK